MRASLRERGTTAAVVLASLTAPGWSRPMSSISSAHDYKVFWPFLCSSMPAFAQRNTNTTPPFISLRSLLPSLGGIRMLDGPISDIVEVCHKLEAFLLSPYLGRTACLSSRSFRCRAHRLAMLRRRLTFTLRRGAQMIWVNALKDRAPSPQRKSSGATLSFFYILPANRQPLIHSSSSFCA